MSKYRFMSNNFCILIFYLFFYTFLHAQHTYVFIGSYNYDKTKEGIFVYELDTLSGNLSKVTAVRNILNPSFLTLSNDGQYIYACTDTRVPKDGSISGFKFSKDTQHLDFINSQKTGGENPVFVSITKNSKMLIAANYNDGSATVFPISDNGSIDSSIQFISYSDSSIHPVRQRSAHIHAAVFSPDEKQVFLPDLGADKIRGYSLNTANLPIDTTNSFIIKTTPGSGPRHLVFHPNGKYAYCSEELSGSVSVYHYKKNKLLFKQQLLTHPKEYNTEFSSADIHLSPDDKFLYVSNRGEENNIAIFAVQYNGKLKIVEYQSAFGKTPRNFAIDESGKFLIVANQQTGNIIVFKRNLQTGKLTKTGTEILIDNPSCVKIKRYP